MKAPFFITLIIIILICSLLILFITKYNEISKVKIKEEDAESEIDEVLRLKFDSINKIVALIEKNEKKANKTFINIKSIESDKYSNFEVDRMLSNAYNEINKIALSNDKVSKSKIYKDNDKIIKGNEEKLIALRTFYNKYSLKYNLLISTFPGVLIAKACGYKKKTLYDGKNLTDENIKDFKI